VAALATKQTAAGPGRDDELEARLEVELPPSIPVGLGNALFVFGSCFHRRRRITKLWIQLDGRRIEPTAQRMPRRDLFEATRGREGAGEAYRSGFWGIVPVEPIARRRVATVGLVARLDDGAEVAAELAPLALEPAPPREPVAWRDGRRTDEPLIAICMASYEPRIDLLRRQLDSIRAQTHANWVCVISDDHSGPERVAEIEALLDGEPRFVLSRAPERLGFYANFERALSMAPAQAAYIALADQDDRWDPDKLEALLAGLGDAQLAYSDARVVGAAGERISDTYWSRRRTNHTNLASLLISNTVTGAASLFRRELLDRVLPFPTRLGTQWHDHWIALVALATGRISYVERPLYDYVQHTEAVVGHAVANPVRQRRSARERARMLRDDWRAAFGGWCWKYFYGVCRALIFARVLELRCGEALTGRKRRALRWFAAIDRSPFAHAWLSARRLRPLAGLNETAGNERLLLQGLAWRRLIAILTWRRRRPPAKLLKDATLPPPGGVDAVARGREPVS
jgi:glycosyltransferase involved in cell wall biosynthesis